MGGDLFFGVGIAVGVQVMLGMDDEYEISIHSRYIVDDRSDRVKRGSRCHFRS